MGWCTKTLYLTSREGGQLHALAGCPPFFYALALVEGPTMKPSQALFERAFILLGADSITLSKSSGGVNKILLIKEPFTPASNLDPTTLTEADFDGYAAREVLTGGLPQSIDPATGDSLITAPPDTTPYLWETTGVTNLPQTIYGFVLTNIDKTVLYGSALLPANVTLTAVNQSIQLPGYPTFRELAGSVV